MPVLHGVLRLSVIVMGMCSTALQWQCSVVAVWWFCFGWWLKMRQLTPSVARYSSQLLLCLRTAGNGYWSLKFVISRITTVGVVTALIFRPKRGQ